MFKELKQRIGQGLTSGIARSSVTHGQVDYTDFVCHFYLLKCRMIVVSMVPAAVAVTGYCYDVLIFVFFLNLDLLQICKIYS